MTELFWRIRQVDDDVYLFAGESVDDCGGGYSESIAEMCDELQNGDSLLPLLIATPNGRDEAGTSRDKDDNDIMAADNSGPTLETSWDPQKS